MHEISWNWVHRRLENATIRHRPRSALAARARGHSSHRDGTMRGWKIHGRSWGQKRSLCQGKTTRDEATKLSNWQVWTMPPKRMASPSSSPFPCRYENAIYAECSNTFCGLILLMKGKKSSVLVVVSHSFSLSILDHANLYQTKEYGPASSLSFKLTQVATLIKTLR